MSKRKEKFNLLNKQRKKIKYVNKISTFETLSDDLFMELFEYFDLYSLYSTFYSLNSRFNSIISHCQVHVNLDKVNPLYFTSFIGQFIYSNIDRGRIISLQSSIQHQMAVLVNDIVMDRFTLLRSLTLSRYPSDLVERILNRIDKRLLENISISSCKHTDRHKFALIQHLLSTERYPKLRSINLKLCSIYVVDISDMEISTQTFDRLEHLSVDKSCEIKYLSNIISRSPNLQSLNIILKNLTNTSFISTDIIKSSSLLRLKLTSSITQQSVLEYLLENCSNLIFLYLDFSTSSSNLIDSEYWLNLLDKMYQLKKIYIRIVIPLSKTNLSHEQVPKRWFFPKRPWLFKRVLFNRMHTIRMIINRSK